MVSRLGQHNYMKTEHSKGIGASIKRLEDKRFLQGQGHYIDDLQLPDMLLCFAVLMLMPQSQI